MYLFTSESVSEGHPDKIADQISDAILDEILSKDKNAAVACETMVKNSLVIVSGEIKTDLWVDIEGIAKEVLKNIGYTDIALGLDYRTIGLINLISQQSQEINDCVFNDSGECQGAGDQGTMFGYAVDEADQYMPAAIFYAHQLLKELAKLRKSGEMDWLGPDAKSQVTAEYDEVGHLQRIDQILISTQHQKGVDKSNIRAGVIEKVINKVIPGEYLDKDTQYIINPSGSFVLGGPYADCGLTGRKIIVDTYGGYAPHGGGAFSGKDPSKVDRSASYMARYIAKNIVGAEIAKKCLIQLSYGIGLSEPLSIFVDTFGTSRFSNAELVKAIKSVFMLTPGGIIKSLDLLNNVRYLKTASYGHFGQVSEDSFTWEKLDKIADLKLELGV